MIPPLTAPKLLAALRIVVCATILFSPELDVARIVAGRDVALRFAPEGLGWLVPLVAPGPVAVTVIGLRASAIFALLGIATRWALGLLAASLFYILGAAQLTGTVTHDMHLLWFVVLLASSPGSAAFSLDGFMRGRTVAPSDVDALSLRAARTWLGLVYFFPGLHKLLDTGGSWITSDNLRNQLWFKWFERGGVVPSLRIDHSPHLLHVLAALVVLFELAMPFLVQHRRTRPVALVGMLCFHLGAGYWLDVLFPSLAVCSVVLLPTAQRVIPGMTRPTRARQTRYAVLALVTLLIVVQGLRGQTQSYPFACYPTFAGRAPDRIVDLAVERDGVPHRLPARRRPDEWGAIWRLAGLYGDSPRPEALEAYADALGGVEPGRVTVIRETYDVRPEAHGAPALSRVVIHVRSPR